MGQPEHPTVDLPAENPELATLVAEAPLDPAGVRDEFAAATAAGDARPGHVCASAWTLDRDLAAALLVCHPRFGWMPPGGHLVAGETVLDAAARELAEETGVTADRSEVLSVHATLIPAKAEVAAHMHWTFGVVHVADRRAALAGEEGQRARWWPLDEPLPDSFFGDNCLLVEFARLLSS